MSCNLIYLSQGRKIAREITSAAEYKALRDSAQQQVTLQAVRRGAADAKRRLIQFNYSCLPGNGGALKGCKTLSRSVGIDVDHLAEEEIEAVRNRIVEQRDVLGLLLLERSARGEGLHIVFRRRVGLSQEENLKWASDLLGVESDKGAKDVTRVFFATTASAERNGRRFLYSRLDEIEGLNQLRTSSRTDNVSQIIKLAFNCSLYGQERVGPESVNECTHVRWNWNASTTPANGKRFFRNAVNDGTLSRINLTTILRGESDEMPVYGQYDETFADNLRPYIERLNACSGVIECPQALKLAKTLLEENAERAALYDSEAYRVLSYRANVIAYLKAMVLYVAHGYRWTKQMEQYVRWSEQMDLWCKMHFFGDELENLIGEETKMSGNGQQNLLEALPESFTADETVEGVPLAVAGARRRWQQHVARMEEAWIYRLG